MKLKATQKIRRLTALCIALALVTAVAGCSGGGGTEADTPQTAPQDVKAAPSTEAAAGPTAALALKGDAKAGKVVYDNYCRFCHGHEGYGDGPIGTAITPHPANFVEDTKRMSKTDAELFESITKGLAREIGGEEMVMPRWQEILTDQERWDVLAYIRELQRRGNEGK